VRSQSAAMPFATSTPPPLDEIPEVKKEHSVTKRAAQGHTAARLAVAPRSFLNTGTKMLPGDRKFWVKEPTPTK
jgi:hypothetical protein